MGEIRTRFDIEGEQQYKKAMSDAAAAIKVLNSEQKLAKAQFQNTGNAEKFAADQARILKEKLAQQKQAVAAAEKALKQLNDNGVAKSSKQFQQWQTKLNNAQTSMVQMETELQKLEKDMSGTASQASSMANSFDTMGSHVSGNASKMSESLANISRKVSFDAVIKGVDSITSSLEKAGSVAARVGTQIWDNITDSAEWADTTATMAKKLSMDVEDYQRYQKVFDTVADITVKDWQKAKNKVQQAVYKGTDEQMDIFRMLGIGIREGGNVWQNNYTSLKVRDWEDIFWEIGDKLREKLESHKITQDQADVYANALFGKSYADLYPVLSMGQDEFNKALAEQNVVSEESINKLAELNDELVKLKSDFRDLQSEVLAGLAPALKGAAEVLSALLARLMEYLKSPDGQKMLDNLGEAVAGLFEDLANIDPESVVENFVSVFTKLTEAFEWIKNNWGAVKIGLAAILGTFAVGKVISGASTFLNLLNGWRTLFPSTPTNPITDTTGPTAPDTRTAPGPGGKPITHNDPTKKPTTDDNNPKVPFDPYALVPLAVIGASITPALIAQNESIEATRERQKKLDAAAEILKKTGSENAEFVARASAVMGTVKNPDGTEAKNILGMAYTQMTDEHGNLLAGLKYRSNAEMAKLEYTLRGYTTLGNNAWTQLNRYWNGNDLDPMEVNDLLNVVTQALAIGKEIKIQGAGITGPRTEEEPVEEVTKTAQEVMQIIMGAATGLWDLSGMKPKANPYTEFLQELTEKYWDERLSGSLEAEANVSKALQGLLDDETFTENVTSDVVWAIEDAIKNQSGENILAALEAALSQSEDIPVDAAPELTDSGAEAFQKQLNGKGFYANVTPVVSGSEGQGYANGLPYVPFNGYPAILHKGERVLTARANRNYTANSNLYVENMNMNNGMDVRALTDAMERQNRRVRAGFGS